MKLTLVMVVSKVVYGAVVVGVVARGGDCINRVPLTINEWSSREAEDE